MRIIVEYCPNISKDAQKIIRDNVTPSMISNDETSCQYEISMCLEELIENDVCVEDYKVITSLIEQGVSYLEF